ncbi:DUF5658 family protein [Alteribacter aurantiacus]|uniref:DUF5658 family protein n=1 Tax=Alteribacter aurantiacus TaxID=254410 RepID=UPI0004109503|nr:DUF5658 family protein [Alteribacter aurantiacus]
MKNLLLSTAIMNVTDAILTMIGIKAGEIIEANPVMAWAYDVHPLFFLTIKILLTLVLLMLIPHLRFPLKRVITGSIILAFCGYVFVHGLHVTWLGMWVGLW